jgi:DNA-binding protein H-NS
MSVDQLWSLHKMIATELARKMTAEKERLDQRLRELRLVDTSKMRANRRRPYPKVRPKCRNPERPKETWAGRGKQPRWLNAQLRSGKKLDDFKIESASWIVDGGRLNGPGSVELGLKAKK